MSPHCEWGTGQGLTQCYSDGTSRGGSPDYSEEPYWILGGGAVGKALAWGVVGVPTRWAAGLACAAGMVTSGPGPSVSGVIYLKAGAIWFCCHGRSNEVFFCTWQCGDFCHCSWSTPCHKPSTCLGVGVATFIASREGCEGILMDRGYWGVGSQEGGEVSLALLLDLLILFTSWLKQLAVGKKDSVGELGLVLELHPVPGLMVPHHML